MKTFNRYITILAILAIAIMPATSSHLRAPSAIQNLRQEQELQKSPIDDGRWQNFEMIDGTRRNLQDAY